MMKETRTGGGTIAAVLLWRSHQCQQSEEEPTYAGASDANDLRWALDGSKYCTC